MEPLEGAVGRRVKISLDDGTHIDGFVHSTSANAGKITLEKVECIENGKKKKLVGLQHYFAEEITNILLLEDVCKNKKKNKTPERLEGRSGGMLRGKCQAKHLDRLAFVEPSSLVLKAKKRDGLTSSGNETGSSDSDMDLPQADHYTIIPKLCNTFYEAIDYITKHHVVAVAMEGVAIGRFGRLCWLQIAVPDHVFMFDVLSIGRACFEEGIKNILENPDILKVLHDCRMASDLLHHQYDINMINVFDTQVANVFVYRLKHHDDWPRYVDGLGSCLVHHLDLPMEEVNWAVVRERRREEDEEVWMERPPQGHLAEAAVKNVKHLLDLRTVLMEKMMEEFVAGVNIYLMHVRDASDQDARRYQTTPHLLPVAFQDIRAFMSSYTGRNYKFNVTEVRKDMNGFRENHTSISQPNLYYSKDSIWHAGNKISGPAKSKPSDPAKAADASPQVEEVPQVTPKSPLIESPTIPSENEDIPSIPSRRNLHKSAESDLVSRTVAALNAKKLVLDSAGSRKEMHNDELSYEQQLAEPDEYNVGELKGGSLMRALIHEQDITGNEAKMNMNELSILPAGKMVSKKSNKKKTRTDTESFDDDCGAYQSVSSRGYSKSNRVNAARVEQSETCDQYSELRSVIPGGDLATYSPPKRRGLTQREQTLIENLEKSRQVGMLENHGNSLMGSDNECLSATTQGQNVHTYNKSVVKSPGQACGSGNGISLSNRLKESGYSSPSGVETDNHGRNCMPQDYSCQALSSPSSTPSDSKLHILLQKLKNQEL